MKHNGILLVCDRCGEQKFLKRLDDKELDGGFTHVEQYEDAPGWDDRPVFRNGVYRMLCPVCNGVLDDLLSLFMIRSGEDKEEENE